MSFVFEWDKLDDEVALQIEGLIHAHFQRIQKPSFMGNIAVSKFRLGSTPPSITVLDITDPLEEWYVHMDQEEARLAQEAAEAGGGESMDEDELASGDEYDDYSYSDGSIGVEADRDDMGYLEPGIFQDNEQQQSEDWFHHQHPGQRRNDIQLLLAVQYQGQMGFTVETELLLNYPTFAFLALPVKLVITGFSLKGKLLMGYLRDHVNVCFLEPEDANESILSDVRIESQVGDEQKQAVLKNVGKIERFVLEQLRKFITEDMVYPSYHSIELVRATPPTPMPQPGNQAAGPRGISSAHPPVDTSVATTHHTNSANVRSSRAPSTSTSTTPSIHSGIGRTQSSNLDYRRH
ncbi:hypothetical protein B0O80DRAFT_379511 [Mortierella sp. GBAus27b]|nr:hypothetical protein B0O80DRAFT_379511 [Mortierella sp. GBAus27b]